MQYPQKIKYSCRRICCLLMTALLSGCLSLSICQSSQLTAHAVSAPKVDIPAALMVSGSPVGIRLEAEGVTVLGFVGFMSQGEFVNPGATGGLQVGDCILRVNQQAVHSSEELRHAVSASQDGQLVLIVRRQETEITLPLKVYKDDEHGEYRIGVWVRDAVTGIGTMTFYDQETGYFAALGHGISGDNGLVPIAGGMISKVTILDAIRGKPGQPGELKGYFPEPLCIAGAVRMNSECGIIGRASEAVFRDCYVLQEYPVMRGDHVHTGKASILCTVCGDQPEAYEVEITAALKDRIYDTKGLTLKITDSRLIDQTGGIVQGMSGSPIIQDGCIIGAVTHVTMNNPTVGYGIFIENMIVTARSAAQSNSQQKAG